MMSTWSDDMMKNWSDAQKRYWDAWSELAKMGQPSSVMAEQPSQNPVWVQGLEQWWKAVSNHLPQGSSQETFQHVVDMGKMYMNLAESAYKAQQTSGGNSQSTMEQWISLLEAGFKAPTSEINQAFAGYGAGVGQVAMDSWHKVLKSLGLETLQQMGVSGLHTPLAENWQEYVNKLIATPAVGYHRESQERLQNLTKLTINYQSSVDDYLKAFAKQGLDAVDTLRKKVKQLQEEGKTVDSLRQLYDLWVDVSEAAYSKFAMTDEYQVVYGDLVNALMALKQGVNNELETFYRSMNIPTRQDMSIAFQRQQELRRENRQLRQQLQALTRRVDAMQSQNS